MCSWLYTSAFEIRQKLQICHANVLQLRCSHSGINHINKSVNFYVLKPVMGISQIESRATKSNQLTQRFKSLNHFKSQIKSQLFKIKSPNAQISIVFQITNNSSELNITIKMCNLSYIIRSQMPIANNVTNASFIV